jgi:hypothetical protein
MKRTRQHSNPRRTLKRRKGDVDRKPLLAKAMSGPFLSNALALHSFAGGSVGEVPLECLLYAMSSNAKTVNAGNMRDVEAFLMSQATALNALFAELCRRSWANLNGGQFETGQQYLRLALKAQNQSRATFETLSTVKNPPAVFARQANVAAQQVNNFIAAPSHAEENHAAPNKLLDASHEKPLDAGTPGAASAGNSQVEAVEPLHRAAKPRR